MGKLLASRLSIITDLAAKIIRMVDVQRSKSEMKQDGAVKICSFVSMVYNFPNDLVLILLVGSAELRFQSLADESQIVFRLSTRTT